MRFSKYVLAAFVGLLTWSGVTAAQCPTPDGLDGGPCCAQANINIPAFPNFVQPALEICWQNCNVSGVLPYVARWTNLPFTGGTVGGGTMAPCGEQLARLELRSAGVLHWTGTMRLQYSRTWMEAGPGGFPIQVWRFLVNGDLRQVLSTIPAPCPAPPCAPAHGGAVKFSGYLDQAQSCVIVPATYQRAWMLTHACDAIDHVPGLPRGGVFHPDRTYSFVGPAAGFVPGPLQPLEGTPGSPLEAMRSRILPVGPPPPSVALCNVEERAFFNLTPGPQFCMCVGGPTAQFLLGNLNVFGGCGSTVTTPGGPFLPGFLSMGIGTWTAPGTYPGVEAVRWTAGNYDWTDACTGAVNNEVFFGVTTVGGFPATQVVAPPLVPAPLPPTFIDQSNSLRPPGVGVVLNMPYVSDHFLNLNH